MSSANSTVREMSDLDFFFFFFLPSYGLKPGVKIPEEEKNETLRSE